MAHGASARPTGSNSNAAVPNIVDGSMATRTAPRQARSAKSLDLILDAAEGLLQDRGVVETSTVDVAAAAGVSVGRLYYWFPDKDAVVRAVLGRAEFRLRALIIDSVAEDARQPSDDFVGQSLKTLAAFFRRHRGSLAVLQRGPIDHDDPGKNLCHAFGELVATAIDARVSGIEPADRDVAAETVVRIIIAMLFEHVRADEADA